MNDIAARVARGAVWLDEHYPQWWERIEISTLDVSSCHLCVLGQVYTGCIPTGEQGQILAQVINEAAGIERYSLLEYIETGKWGGYNTLVDYHGLACYAPGLGFSIGMGWTDTEGTPVTVKAEMAMLTDEWTRVIISRRLAPYRAEQAAELVAA